MSREWKEVKLGDIVEISSSKRIYAREYVESGVPFYRSKEIIEKSSGRDISKELYISKERFDELKNKFGVPKDGDILLTSVGTLGVPYIVIKEEFYFKDGNLTWLKNFKDNCYNKFIYYWLLSDYGRNQINSRCIGSTQKALTIDTLKKFDVNLPPLEEQKAIANILSTIDEKIEVNNEINKKLEEMAQAIFKHWFVDFEFPNEDGEPYKSSGGEMVESELGMIPKGWEVVEIEDITKKANTGADAIRRAPIVDYKTEVKCVRVGDLSQGRNISGWGFCEVSEEDYKRFQLKRNDILITRTGTIGLNMLIFEDLKAVFNNGLIRLKVKDKFNPIFIYQVINSKDYYNYINMITGETSTRPNMKINYLLKYKFVLPPQNIRDKFTKILYLIISNMYYNNNENEMLADLRDTLLPKLMSGEIRVPLGEDDIS